MNFHTKEANEEMNKSKATEGAEGVHEEKHESWFAHTLHKIEDALAKIDTDFPLSGGETEEEFRNVEKAHY